MLKAVAVWLLILACAVLNGALREFVLLPRWGTVPAFVFSGLLLCGCIVLLTLALVPWFGVLPARRWWAIGLLWLALTLTFEFGFGRVVQQRSWGELFDAYRFREGNLWPLVLLVTALAPPCAAWLRHRVAGR